MKQRKLEMLLEELENFSDPELELEQYQTPPPLAAEILHFAYMQGDLDDSVQDLGCGTGILAIGAKLLGAKRVIGYDADPKALEIAKKNAEKLGVEVEFVLSDINDITEHVKTTVMNPPFGARVKGRDRPFLSSALRTSEVIYSIHNRGSLAFIQKFIKPAVITHSYVAKFPIKRTFDFHKKERKVIEVEIYRIKVSG
ncbi:MAG: METTL5 family protein [Methanosarcina thermophila]|jgi:putative methylase|uniref:Methyltransferase n=3 Tax=Methanosarcina thermophila TaxID=2210 RepID=A0A1I6XDJ4_METTE|nr:METTL5 family protein [Methanosarcina thermophila]ALK04508.1 MAG: methyltransferase [Methanosarcina sp. 795]AKB13157.1 ribosomal protein L11 methyltransferase [Methanosarcina thermophila TM-1]NLU57119.1 methyltransferase [Methanosarcina thermophila]SFT36277.1 methyltransferase [Methanosarcina thermophila]BAW28148.1 methyltransferase [Methanosarcina thermophila]